MNQIRLFEAVKDILFSMWDPIGVNDNPSCSDEYDAYAPTIVRLLLEGADEHKIMGHLRQSEINLGLPQADEPHDLQIARQLINLVQKP